MILIENLWIHCLYKVDIYFILPLIFYASLGYILTYNNVFSEFVPLWVLKGFRFTNVWRNEEGDYNAKWWGLALFDQSTKSQFQVPYRSMDVKFFWVFYEFLGTQMLNYANLETDRSNS